MEAHLASDILRLLLDQKKYDGVSLNSLKAGTLVEIQTQNSIYRMLVLSDGEVLAKGGRHFPDWRRVFFRGSTWGTSMIRVGWIGQNMHLEFWDGMQSIKTSCVQHFNVLQLEAYLTTKVGEPALN